MQSECVCVHARKIKVNLGRQCMQVSAVWKVKDAKYSITKTQPPAMLYLNIWVTFVHDV